jgi:hypothetical protein
MEVSNDLTRKCFPEIKLQLLPQEILSLIFSHVTLFHQPFIFICLKLCCKLFLKLFDIDGTLIKNIYYQNIGFRGFVNFYCATLSLSIRSFTLLVWDEKPNEFIIEIKECKFPFIIYYSIYQFK